MTCGYGEGLPPPLIPAVIRHGYSLFICVGYDGDRHKKIPVDLTGYSFVNAIIAQVFEQKEELLHPRQTLAGVTVGVEPLTLTRCFECSTTRRVAAQVCRLQIAEQVAARCHLSDVVSAEGARVRWLKRGINVLMADSTWQVVPSGALKELLPVSYTHLTLPTTPYV